MKMNRREFLEDSSKMVLAGLVVGGTVGAGKTAAQTNDGKRKYRLIATEEAFTIPEQADVFRRVATGAYSNPDLDMWRSFLVPDSDAPPLLRRLHDLEGERIEIMNRSGSFNSLKASRNERLHQNNPNWPDICSRSLPSKTRMVPNSPSYPG